MKKLALVVLILAAAQAPALSPALAQAQVMQPGLWEITSTSTGMTMPGMEDMPPEAMAAMGAGQTTTFRHCLTPEDAAKGPGQAASANRDSCKVINQKVSGSNFDTTLACADDGTGPVQIHSKGTASATRFDATSEVTMASEGMTLTGKVTGTFLGPCK